jgi:hypothetical protein
MDLKLLAALLLAALAVPGRGQDRSSRPSEDELFGAQPAAPAAPAQSAPAPAAEARGAPEGASHGETEQELFGTPAPRTPRTAAPAGLLSREQEDWLKIGGQLQLLGQVSAYQGSAARDWPLASPNLVDVYLDGRPNDRVRGFVLGRFRWDPSVADQRGAAVPFQLGSPADQTSGALDQLWINFDVAHRAFVTAGRQHVKWGVGKVWNPTDYLHPVKRDPLAALDTRTGTTLVKLHVPWEKRGWNFYAIGLLEDAGGDPGQATNRLGKVGAGARAELVLGPAELGLDVLAQDGHHPRWGLDLSGGLGDLDLYGEAALRTGGDGPRWRRDGAGGSGPYAPLLGWERDPRERLTPQLVGGATWSFKYSDEDSFTVGAEYFYNSLGYDRATVYPFLLLGAPAIEPGATPPTVAQQDPSAYRAFYLGRHYAALSLTVPRPGNWNDLTVVLTTLANLSDQSYLTRLDCSVLALTYLTVEAWAGVHYGRKGGEFRLALPDALASQVKAAYGTSTFPTGAPVVDVGIALRMAL